jgi:uncharacterized protein (UPF0276 family)
VACGSELWQKELCAGVTWWAQGHDGILLTANVSDPLLELIRCNEAPVDGVEVGLWFSVRQICQCRQMLPRLPFTFHGSDLIERVGIIPGTAAKIAAYLRSTGSPWILMHITMWLPGMMWLLLRRRRRMPVPDPAPATQRFARRVRELARSIQVPVILENVEPLPLDGYDFEVQAARITGVRETLGCGLLLDTGNARVSASTLGMDVHDYLSGLPLDRVAQVHVSGPPVHADRLIDAHQPMQEVDYELLSFVLSRTRPGMVNLEYIRERNALNKQLSRLRHVVDSQ